MKLKIWGCRGSIARSHPSLIKYGGNTPCCEVQSSDGTRIVLDMGSGAFDLGQELVKMGKLEDQHVLLTHTHWDHIQGFPFFAPLFVPGSEWTIHAPGGFSSSLKEKMASQMSHDFFPLSIDYFAADIQYKDLKEGDLQLGTIEVSAQYLNHSVLTLGYRLEDTGDGASLAYITDHEPFDHRLATQGYQRADDQEAAQRTDDRHVAFFDNVDLLLHDAQYLAKEYPSKEGWGHSTVEYVVDVAMAARVGKLLLFHHDPQRTDKQLDEIVALAQKRVRQARSSLIVQAAKDYMSVDIRPSVKDAVLKGNHSVPESAILTQCERSNKTILIHHDSVDLFRELKKDGLELTYPSSGQSVLDAAKKIQPALLVLTCTDPERLLETTGRLRSDFGEWGAQVPIIVVFQNHEAEGKTLQLGKKLGVTQWDSVVEPFFPAYIRTRIRMALSRHPCRWMQPKIPKNEARRLAALNSLKIAPTPEERFDRITKTCATVFDVPFVFVTLIEERRQSMKSTAWNHPVPRGGTPKETPRDVSICAHAINQDDLLIVPDLAEDDRFADNPAVQVHSIRFYAGCPIDSTESNGSKGALNIGTLCLMDTHPREFDETQKTLLRDFAGMVRRELLLPGPVSSSRCTI